MVVGKNEHSVVTRTKHKNRPHTQKIKFSDVRKHVCDWFEQKTGQKCSTVAIATALLSIVGGLTYRYTNQKSSNTQPVFIEKKKNNMSEVHL
jgi:hypothetical protein